MGPTAEIGQVVFARYTGRLPDGTTFDESQDFPIPESILPGGTPFAVEEGATIPGFFEGLQQVKKGGKYTLYIPAEKAYGSAPPPDRRSRPIATSCSTSKWSTSSNAPMSNSASRLRSNS